MIKLTIYVLCLESSSVSFGSPCSCFLSNTAPSLRVSSVLFTIILAPALGATCFRDQPLTRLLNLGGDSRMKLFGISPRYHCDTAFRTVCGSRAEINSGKMVQNLYSSKQKCVGGRYLTSPFVVKSVENSESEIFVGTKIACL